MGDEERGMDSRICASCRAENDALARYCDQCGTRLPDIAVRRSYTPNHLAERILQSRAALQGERKRVTVLFADIKGSTRLAEQAGAEAWHGILDRFFAILTGAVHRHEGTVNQYTGDGIMALFGAPIAHEDHAQRACLAALAMQDGINAYGAELRERRGLELRLRVGLNTGEVIVGRIGDDLRMDYTAKGLTVNLAARMENLCEPGRIYLSRYTAALVRDDFRLRDLDEHRVDGLDHPVRVFLLEGLQRHERLDDVQSEAAAEFVGRDAQLARLSTALAALRGGRGGIIGLRGDAGMGKSRLCREFAKRCAAAAVPLHAAMVPAYAAATPLVALRALLRSRLGLHEGDASARVGAQVAAAFASRNPERSALVPLVRDFLDAGVDQPLAASGLRSLMLERIARVLPRGDGPQVLLIEDLHHAGPLLIDFLCRLCEQMATSPALLLLSYRDHGDLGWLRPYLDDELELPALDEASLQRLAASLLGPGAGLDTLARRIAGLAAGNPYFVEEAVQALVGQGDLQGLAGTYALVRPVQTLPIPDSVHALLAGRIDRLPETQKALLQAAAIMGTRFRPRLLAFSGGDADTLEALVQAGLVRREGGSDDDPHYVFCQPLLQEVAYQGQLESQRRATHAGLAAALEVVLREAPTGDADLAIAHHWECAEQWQQAGRWNLLAAQRNEHRDSALALRQFRLAVQNFDRADASFEVLRQRIAARAGLVRMAQSAVLERAEVDMAYHDAWKMAEECADMASAAELLFSYAPECLQRGQADEAAQLAADAVAQAQLAASPALLARFRDTVLSTHLAAGRIAQGIALCSDGDDAWLRSPATGDTAPALAAYGAALTWQGRLAEAGERLRAAADCTMREGLDPVRAGAALIDWAWFSGRGGALSASLLAALRRAGSEGSVALRSPALRALGLAELLAGDAPRAIDVLASALPLLPSPGPVRASLLAALATACVAAGRDAEARRHADQAIDEASVCGARTAELWAWAAGLPLSDAARRSEGLTRMAMLIETTGAEVFRPWLLLAQAGTLDEPQRSQRLGEAEAAFSRIGVLAHTARFARETG
ncbi:MAG: hypothetical protein E6R07_04500 [Nevskiaceae bacterium]|nr:MAG: hypothetical protein E6R07_04500 [Nevskiaceae bacterium]